LKGGASLLALASMETNGAQRRPCWRVGRIEMNRFLDLPRRTHGIIQAPEHVSEQDVRICAGRIRLQRTLCDGLGFFVFAGN
jgi:hypothetical protein